MDKSLYSLGGSTWINLINTTYMSNKQVVDILQDQSSTRQWLMENNLIQESDEPFLENKELFDSLISELQSFRQLCQVILSDIKQQKRLSQHTTDQLKMFVEQVKVRLTFISDGEKLNLVPEGMTLSDHVRYNILYSIIHTLSSIPMERLRQCEHMECILHFVDTSKSGKRRWCSMEMCGNRQKASEFYSRKKIKKQ